MAVTVYLQSDGTHNAIGLAADTKPTTGINTNSKFFETDTGRIWYYTGSAWSPIVDTVVGSSVEVISSSVASSAYSNGVSYIPLRVSNSDTISGQFLSNHSGNIELAINYVMSAANGGTVNQQLSYIAVSAGGNPSASLTAGGSFTVTPGNDTNTHRVTSTNSSTFKIATTKNDLVYFILTRASGDTHTGDMRILQISFNAVL